MTKGRKAGTQIRFHTFLQHFETSYIDPFFSSFFLNSLRRQHCRSHDDRAGSFLKQILMTLQIGIAACVLGTMSDRDAFEEI